MSSEILVPARTAAVIATEIFAEMTRLGLRRFNWVPRTRSLGRRQRLAGLFEELLDHESVSVTCEDVEIEGVFADCGGKTLEAYGQIAMGATVDLARGAAPFVVIQNPDGFAVDGPGPR